MLHLKRRYEARLRRMKRFAASPQSMKHGFRRMKRSLFRLHVFLPWEKGKKMAAP